MDDKKQGIHCGECSIFDTLQTAINFGYGASVKFCPRTERYKFAESTSESKCFLKSISNPGRKATQPAGQDEKRVVIMKLVQSCN